MFDHVGLKVTDLDRSTRFYEAALEPLGWVVCVRDEHSVGIGPPNAPALWLYPNSQAGAANTHLAFKARERAAVERFHDRGCGHGGRDHGEPGIRSDYAPNYYAAFLIDPDGNNIEVVCME